MLLCKQEEAGVQLNAEQDDLRDDIDDELEDQELEAHYMYMAKIQEVSPDAADFRPIFDAEPLQKVSNDDHYNVFAIESEHPEKSNLKQIDQNDDYNDLANERKLLAYLIKKLKCEIDDSKNRNKFLETSNKVLIEKLKGEIEDFKIKNKTLESSNNRFKEAKNKLSETNKLLYNDFKKSQAELERRNEVEYASKVEINCAKAKGDLISYKMESQKSFNKYTQQINNLNQTILEMKKKLSAHQETISILSQQKEAQIKLYKTREDKELDKVIALENKVKVLDDIVYKTGQSVQTMNMLNNKCRTSFAKLEFLKKAQRANPRLYDIGAVMIKQVYYVEGLNHNLFYVGQFCDADLEVAFRKSTCYIRDLKGNDILTGSRGTDLYSITLQDTNSPNPICLMAKATSSQAWLWHRRLSHLNFDTIDLLSKNDIVDGLPKLKFVKDHLYSSCELLKAKRKSNSPTSVSRPQLKSNQIKYRVMLNNSQGKKQEVEDHRRNVKFSKNKTSVTACNDILNAKTLNVNFVCVTCMLNEKHDMCVLTSLNGVNSRTKMPMAVPISTREPKRTVNQSVIKPLRKIVASESTNQKPRYTTRKLYEHVSKACSLWYPKFTQLGYKWKPKSQIGNVNTNVSMPLGNASRTANILEPMTPREMIYSQAWLWHRHLSHLNFDTINLLSKNDIVIGLPRLKFVKDHLCSSSRCEMTVMIRDGRYWHTIPGDYFFDVQSCKGFHTIYLLGDENSLGRKNSLGLGIEDGGVIIRGGIGKHKWYIVSPRVPCQTPGRFKYGAISYRKYRRNLINGKSISIESNGLVMQPEGPIPRMTPTQALTAIQTMANHSQKRHDGKSSRNVSNNNNTDGLAAIVSKLDNLGCDVKKFKENVYATQVGSQLCEGPHLDKECPLNEEVKQVEEVTYRDLDAPILSTEIMEPSFV
nr:retrovirus-related Pol polyprotein from transposon TNT 1-94 [Tanacetum cinerariifolium]